MEFIFTAILVIIFFAILVLGHEIGHFITAKLFKFEVQEFGFGLPPKIFGRKWRGTEYSLNAIPFGGFVRVPALDYSTEESFKIPFWKKAIVFASGVFMNFIIAWVVFSIIFMIGAPKGVHISAIIDNSPAQIAGLEVGDKLIDFQRLDPFINLIENTEPGDSLTLRVERQRKILNIMVAPAIDEGVGRIGVQLMETGFPKEGFFQSFQSGIETTWSFILKIIEAIIGMFRYGDFTDAAGPVEVFVAIQVTKDMGIIYFLQLLGVVSLNLMIINFLPLPALDGGHILILLVEKIKRKPISRKIILRINSISYSLLLLLMFVVTIRGIINLF